MELSGCPCTTSNSSFTVFLGLDRHNPLIVFSWIDWIVTEVFVFLRTMTSNDDNHNKNVVIDNLNEHEQYDPADLPVTELETVLARDRTEPTTNFVGRRSPFGFLTANNRKQNRNKSGSDDDDHVVAEAIGTTQATMARSQSRPYDERSNLHYHTNTEDDNTMEGYTDTEEGFTSGNDYDTETDTDFSYFSDNNNNNNNNNNSNTWKNARGNHGARDDDVPVVSPRGEGTSLMTSEDVILHPNDQLPSNEKKDRQPNCDTFDCCNFCPFVVFFGVFFWFFGVGFFGGFFFFVVGFFWGVGGCFCLG